MRSAKYRSIILAIAFVVLSATAFSQSTDQNFPTALTSPEISGTIRARDIGDARLTTYYFAFNGGQGDIFINAVTNNFAGDIDIFTADTLQPLAKMVSYPEAANSETGRLIYLRKPTKLLLRVEGRSPDDNPATFKIKFGGSFIALEATKEDKAPSLAKTDQDESGRRVNSVGTIIAVPTPELKASATAKVPAAPKVEPPTTKVEEKPATAAKQPATRPSPVKTTPAPDVKTVFGNRGATRDPKSTTPPRASTPAEAKPETSRVPPAKSVAAPPKPPSVVVEKAKADPMASIYLVVELKAGDSIRTPMSEVRTFNVDRGILTVVFKNGKTTRYSITDVSSFTMR